MGPSKKEIKNKAVESILFSDAYYRKGEHCWLRAISKLENFDSCREKKAQATEAVHTESVGLEKFLAKKEDVGGKMEGFSAVTTSPMQAETWSIKPVKLLLVLLAKQGQTLIKLPNRELIRRLEIGEPK